MIFSNKHQGNDNKNHVAFQLVVPMLQFLYTEYFVNKLDMGVPHKKVMTKVKLKK